MLAIEAFDVVELDLRVAGHQLGARIAVVTAAAPGLELGLQLAERRRRGLLAARERLLHHAHALGLAGHLRDESEHHVDGLEGLVGLAAHEALQPAVLLRLVVAQIIAQCG